MDKQYLKLLLLDLLQLEEVSENGRYYKMWKTPILLENIDWLNQNKGPLSIKVASHNDEILTRRLDFLINQGIDLKESVYDIARVNCPLMLQKALDNGADPNIEGKNGQLPIDLAITKGHNQIAKLLVNSENFNFISNNKNYPNILLWTMSYSKIELAQNIIIKKPDLVLEKVGELSFAYLGSLLLSGDNYKSSDSTLKEDLLKILEFGIKYAYEKGHYFSIYETHKGESIMEHSVEVANIIKKFEVENLNQSLNNSDKKNLKKTKI